VPSWVIATSLAVITGIVFLPSLSCGFVNWDDHAYVYENDAIMGPLTADCVWQLCTRSYVGNWAPLTMLSYRLDASLFGPGPWGFHLTNVVGHALATGLFFVALNSLTRAPRRSLAAALLFGIHPLRVESVTWIAERKDVLTVVFLMLALIAYEYYCRHPRGRRFLLVAAAMTASLLCKPMLVTLPVLLLLVDIWPLARVRLGPEVAEGGGAAASHPTVSWRQALFEKGVLACISAAFVAITLVTQSQAMARPGTMGFFSARLPNACYAFLWYLWKTVAPIGLCGFRRHLGAELTAAAIAGCVFGLCVLGAVAFALRHRAPALLWGLSWYVISLLPVIGLVQVGSQGVADRYAYVPHVGLAVAVVWTLADLAAACRLPRRTAPIACAAAASLLAALSMKQIATWQDSLTLWSHCLAIEPRAAVPHYNYACALEDAGNRDDALLEYESALVYEPLHGGSLDNLSALLIEQGRPQDARPLVERSLGGDPGALTYANLAAIFITEQKPAEAIEAAERAVAAEPGEARGYFALGRARAAAGDRPSAIAAYQEAVRRDGRHVSARNNLATALAREGRLEESLAEFSALVAIEPQSAVAARNLAIALEQIGRLTEAVAAWRRVVLLDPADMQAADRLRWLTSRANAISSGDSER